LIAAATPAPQPARLWPGPTLIGVQAHARRLGVPYFTRIAKAHVDVVRLPLVPWWAQTKSGERSWTDLDAIYAWLGAHSVAPLFVLQNPRTPDDVPTMVEFAKQAAQRYPRALLELGNEPDNPGQWPGFYPPHASKPLDPAGYWAIERQFARAWRAGNPRARIATGGTSGMDFGWQKKLIAAIAADGAFGDGTINAIAVHPYEEPLPGKRVRRGGLAPDLATLKALLPDGIEVWLTEYGLVDPQPRDVDGWFAAVDALGVPVFSWYEIQDDVLSGRTYRFGLVNLDGTPKPAYDAARTYLTARTPAP
jgi:hypothetical protein